VAENRLIKESQNKIEDIKARSQNIGEATDTDVVSAIQLELNNVLNEINEYKEK